MNIHLEKRNEKLAETVINGLKSRNMTGYYAKDKEEALSTALSLIPKGSSIAMGGCMSAGEIGLVATLQEGDYHFIDRTKMELRWNRGRRFLQLMMPTFSFPVPML